MEQTKIANSWSDQQVAFARFLASNGYDTDMKKWTQEEYATSVGIHPVTLSNWKKIPGFMQLVSKLVPDTLHKFVPHIMVQQVKAARDKGDLAAAKFVLNQADLLKSEKQQVEHGVDESVVGLFAGLRKAAEVLDGEYTEQPAIDAGGAPVDDRERTPDIPRET